MAEVEGYDLEGFGQRVRDRRRELGLTQAQLAKRIGVDETAVRRWEDGVLPRDAVTLVRLAVTVERSVGWVLGENRDAVLLDGMRLALDHLLRVTTQDRNRLDFEGLNMLVEMKSEYKQPAEPLARVAVAPAVPMESASPPAGSQKRSKRSVDRAG